MRTTTAVLIVGVMLASSSLFAQDASKEKDEEAVRTAKLIQIYHEHARSYVMQEPDSGTTLELQPKPVFNWLNTARVGTPRVQHGAVFVWTHKGRAEVIGTVFSQTIGAASPSMYHEFHSLSPEPITAIRDNVVHWDVQQAGIEPNLVPDAPEPSQTRPLRMIQMREMARRFSGYSINYDDKRWDLSLLPQPLHRTDGRDIDRP